MKFSLLELQQRTLAEPYYFSGKVDVSEIKTWNNDIRQIDDVDIDGMCTVDNEEFIFSLSIKGTMILPCARTLVDVPYSFDIQATEIFTTSPTLTTEEEEENVHLIEDEMIHLTPLIKEIIVIETPFRVFSEEKGIESGEGWEFYHEDSYEKEKEDKIDPRLAKLGKLLDKNDDET